MGDLLVPLLFVTAVSGYTVRSRLWGKRTGHTLKLLILSCLTFCRMKVTDPNVLEVFFVGLGLAGIAAIYWPAALIFGGFLGVVSCERASGRRIDSRNSYRERNLRRVA